MTLGIAPAERQLANVIWHSFETVAKKILPTHLGVSPDILQAYVDEANDPNRNITIEVAMTWSKRVISHGEY